MKKKIIITGIKMPVVHTEEEAVEAAEKLARLKGIAPNKLYIYKKSLDARRKNDIHFVYSVAAEAENISDTVLDGNIRLLDEEVTESLLEQLRQRKCRDKTVLVVGSGPCGLFAAYILAAVGVKTILIERGCDVDTREKKVKSFWNGGVLDPNTNIQFGEGGAGTFSDGKLNTGIGSPLQRFVLKTLNECGAPDEILYQAKPHIGTDILKLCVKNLRGRIKAFGGEILFESCLTDIETRNGKICGAIINKNRFIACDALVLALGHSSRDTYEMLDARGVALEQKPFAVGVRIEHSREFINRAQYGSVADIEKLPTADYKLVHNGENRSCYSFCMCPGGIVVNAASEEGHLVVNGMSNHRRMAQNSNSALVVTVKPEDFQGSSPLAGVEFQRRYEKAAYDLLSGKGPVQLTRDFLNDRVSDSFDGVLPSFTGETGFADLKECLPQFVSAALKDGLRNFEKRIKGFSYGNAVLTGVEMRTSAPLRIKRDKNFESISHKGIFPAGEGAGYAGGIMSAAVDGIKVAMRLLDE